MTILDNSLAKAGTFDAAATKKIMLDYANKFGIPEAVLARNVDAQAKVARDAGEPWSQYTTPQTIAQYVIQNSLWENGQGSLVQSFIDDPQRTADQAAAIQSTNEKYAQDQATDDARMKSEVGAGLFAGAKSGINMDIAKAAQSLGVTYTQAQDALKKAGWDVQSNAPWNGDQNIMQALGSALGKNYQGYADSIYNPTLAASQNASRNATMTAAQKANNGGMTDLGRLWKLGSFLGSGAFSGIGGFGGLSKLLGGGLGGVGAADAVGGANIFGDGLAGFNGGLTETLGYGASPTAVAGSSTGGGMGDWEQLLSDLGYDPSYGQGVDIPMPKPEWTGNSGGFSWQGGADIPTSATGIDLSWLNQLPPGTQSAVKAALGLGGASGSSGIGNLLGGLIGNQGLGALAGGLLGGLGGNQKPAGNTTTTTVSDFPDWYKNQYVQPYLNQVQSTFNSQGAYDPSLVNAANAEQLKTVQGQYLDPATNPYLQKTYDMGAQNLTQQYNLATKPGMDAQFNRANAFGVGNSAWEQYDAENKRQLGNSLQNLGTNIFGGNYQQERARQASASSGAPGFSASSQSAPYAGQSAYGSLLGNFKPQSQTNTQPYFSNTGAGILGGALAGSQFGKLFGA